MDGISASGAEHRGTRRCRRRRRRAQRPRRRRVPRQGRAAPDRARGPRRRRRRGRHRAAVGSRLQGHVALLRDEPDARRHRPRPRPPPLRLHASTRWARPTSGCPTGAACVMAEDDARTASSRWPRSPSATPTPCERWDAWLDGIAEVLGPLLTAVPPKLGSQAAGRPRSTRLRLAWRLRGLDVGSASDVTRLFAMSIGDLLREWFETDAVQAMMAVNGIIGTWAGPEEPGTAYVMLHHSIGDVGDGQRPRGVGLPARRDGRGVRRRCASAAESFGADRAHRRPGRAGPARSNGARHRRRARRRRRARHRPRRDRRPPADRASCATSTPASCPTTSSTAIRRWRSRSGTVKINLALSELPDFVVDPGTHLQPHHTGAIELAHSLDYLETAFVRGPPRRRRRPARSATAASRACSTTRWRRRGTTS